MATIGEVSGATIKVNPNDHSPPHVHVHHQGREVKLLIANASLMKPARGFHAGVLRDVTEWLLRNRDIAADKWAEYHDD